MPNVIETLRQKAIAASRRIIFPETHDERVIAAIEMIQSGNMAQCIAVQHENSLTIPTSATVVSVNDNALIEKCIQQYVANRAHKGLNASDAEIAIRNNPLLFASLW